MQRYEIDCYGCDAWMEKRDDGDYVLYDEAMSEISNLKKLLTAERELSDGLASALYECIEEFQEFVLYADGTSSPSSDEYQSISIVYAKIERDHYLKARKGANQ